MQDSERFKDWQFRYQNIYGVRRSEKNKGRFLSALLADISEIRNDVQVIEYDRSKKNIARNVYVGDIEKADRIICTYYDTPIQNISAYALFNRKEQEKRTTRFIVFSSLLLILLGVLGTLFFINKGYASAGVLSVPFLMMVLIYGVYFYVLGKATKGFSNRKTLIRNTSSILTLLSLLKDVKGTKTAFAFIDEGSLGSNGLEALRAQIRPHAQIFLLDSVGADAPLVFMGKGIPKETLAKLNIEHERTTGEMNYLFAANVQNKEGKNNFYLDKTLLSNKTINMDNIQKVVTLFKSL